MKNLVSFPSPLSPHLEDSGEGGMYAIMVVPKGGGAPDLCSVGVNIQLTDPDILINLDRMRDVWGDGGPSSVHAEPGSLPLRAAVFLGSTSSSLWDEEAGNYWYARPDDLTEDGRVLHDALRCIHGAEPLLLTFLDT